ncbi:MAG TPA: alpha/beta hydrolase, partial [Acidimicrobiia bacterium]
MEHVDVDGLRIAYERAGEGTPLLLVHGYVSDGPTTWRPQLEELSDDYTVVAWDAPGAGRSSDPPESFGMAGYADCLAGFRRALGLRGRPHVAGISFGGALALELYRRHRDVPGTLVLASAYAGWAGSLSPDVVEQRSSQARALARRSPADFVEELLPTMFTPDTAPAVVEEFGATLGAFHPIGFRAMAHAASEDLSAVLPTITVPTLLVYGSEDTRAPLPVAQHLHAAIPGSVLVVLPDVGHLCNLEAPHQFNSAV